MPEVAGEFLFGRAEAGSFSGLFSIGGLVGHGVL